MLLLFLYILQVDSTSLVNTTFTAPNVIGWVLSSVVSVLLTVFLYPFLENKFQSFVVRRLNFLGISTGKRIAGTWTHKWYVSSPNFDPLNEVKGVVIKQFRKKIFAEYDVLDKKGRKCTYQMLGSVDKDLVITGIWRDIEKGNRYHGCFQLYIDINEDSMTGYWTGLSRELKIKSDKWE